jgi:hypothetical protein
MRNGLWIVCMALCALLMAACALYLATSDMTEPPTDYFPKSLPQPTKAS